MKKKGKMFLIIIIVLIAALLAIYNFGTSQYCIKNIILPIVAKKTDSKINLNSIQISLLGSSIDIDELKYQSSSLTATADKLTLKTSIYDVIFSHKINVKSFLMKNGHIDLSLDSANAPATKKVTKEKSSSKDKTISKNKSYKLSLNNIKLENINLIVHNNDTLTKITNLNINIPKLEPNETSDISLNGNISLKEGQKLIKGSVKSSTHLTLNEQLLPTSINSNSIIELNGNKTPLVLRLDTQNSKKFNFELTASNIFLTPIAKAFIPGRYNNTKGIIKDINIEATGNDINDLRSGSSPISTKISITGTDISSPGNFSLKNQSFLFNIDMASVIKGTPKPGQTLIKNLDTVYTINKDQRIKIEDFNLKLTTNENNSEYKAILNSNFIFEKDKEIIKGSASGKLSAKAPDIINPQEVTSSFVIVANGQRMPLNLYYKNNNKMEKASIDLENFDLTPFSALLENKLKNFHARVASLNLNISGQSLDSIKNGLKKGNNIPLETVLSAKNIEINQEDKISAIVPDISINIDLNKIINKSIKINSCKIDDAKIVFVQETQEKASSSYSNNTEGQPKRKQENIQQVKIEETPEKVSILNRISLNDIAINNVDITLKNGNNITNIDGLNLDIPNIEPEQECKATFDCKLAFKNNSKNFEGGLQSDTVFKVNSKFFPIYLKSQSLIDLDNTKTPLNINLNTKDDDSFDFSLKASDLIIKPLAQAFFPVPYNNTTGYIKNINITASGDNINDLKSTSEPVIALVELDKVNVNSADNFAVKNNLLKASFNLSSILLGKPLIDYITIQNLNGEYNSKGQTSKVNGLNLKLTQDNSNKYKLILNTDFVYIKDTKKLSGSAAGNAQITAKNMAKPEQVYSKINLILNDNQIPIDIKYNNNDSSESANIEIKNLKVSPLTPILSTNMQNLQGGAKELKISLSADGHDGLKTGFKKGKNIAVETRITATNIDIKDKNNYLLSIPDIDVKLDAARALDKKYYIDLLHMNNAEITLYKKNSSTKAKSKKTKNGGFDSTNNTENSNSTQIAKSTTNDTDLDIRDLIITKMKLNIISDRKLALSNINITSKRIKTSTPANISASLNYLVDNKLSGKVSTDNTVTISPKLLPSSLHSNIEVAYSNKVSYSTLDFTSKQSTADLIPFKLKTNVKDLKLDPFLKTLVQQPYNKTKATLNELKINLSGNNLYDFKTMDGKITSDLSKVSVPINVGDENIIEVLFFPIRIIANLASSTALKFVTGNIASAMRKIDDMFNRKKRIDFVNGDLNIKLKKGLIDIKNFDFFGEADSPVTEMKINGLINMNNKALDLKTNTILAGIIIPLEIGGTIQNPKTDTAKLTAQLFQKNTKTLINTGLETTGTVISTIDKIKKNNFVDLLKPTSTNSTQSNQSNSSSTTQNITNTVSNVLNILGGSDEYQTSSQSQNQSGQKNKKKTIKVDDAIKNLLNF